MLYLGIDQHHEQLTIRDGEGTVILKRQVSTRPEKAQAFLDDVCRRAGAEGFMAVLEVCGSNDWLIKLLNEVGCREVVLIHPGKRSRRKTDRRDASKLLVRDCCCTTTIYRTSLPCPLSPPVAFQS